MKRLNKDYILEVWVITFTLTPFYIFLFSFLFFSNETPNNLVKWWFILAFSGAYLSIPALGINLLVYRLLSAKINSALMIKFLHIILSIGIITGTYMSLPKESLLNPGEDIGIFIISIATAVISASSLFRVYRRNSIPVEVL